MSDTKTKEQRLLDAQLPTALPVGMTEFNEWAQDIIELYDFPNNDTIVGSLAAMILDVKPFENEVPKFFFSKLVKTAMAKQVAGQVFYDLKSKRDAAARAEAEAAKQQALEATNTTTVATNENQETSKS